MAYLILMTVQSEDYNGSKLLVKGLVTRDFWLDFPDVESQESKDEIYPTITPKHVQHFVLRAIEKGWQYKEKGANFELLTNNQDLR